MENQETQKSSGLYNKWNFEIGRFASKEASRYTLQAILVEPSATVVTDGHRLIKVTAPNHGTDLDNFPVVEGVKCVRPVTPKLLPAKAAMDMAKAIPHKERMPIFRNAAMTEQGNDHIGFVTTDLETSKPVVYRKAEGAFPNYDICFPKDEPTAKIAFNADFMSEICKFMGQFSRVDRSLKVTMTLYGPDKAMKLEASNSETGQEAVALLMPMRL